MDIRQLFVDIISFNFKSFRLRSFKLKAVLKRLFFMPFRNHLSYDVKKIPIIINNRNRLTYLLELIKWLEQNGYINIFIIDNDSTYPPLLEYYSKTKYKIFKLNENIGHLALWKSGIISQFEQDYYVYTDSDIVPIAECPDDVLEFFMLLLRKYKGIEKVGFGLKIDDLPDHYTEKQKVITWEKKFWEKEVEKDVFDAAIDTTFALYRPYTNGAKWVQNAYRTGGKYVARHLPWYENSLAQTEEQMYYKNTVKFGASHWIPVDE